MAYTPYDATKPDAATQAGTAFGASTRSNLNALRDALIIGGGFFGWTLTVTAGTGTADAPQYLTYANGTERVRVTLTWAGGAVTQAIYDYSANSGTDYTTSPGGRIGTKTITYDGNGNVASTAWA